MTSALTASAVVTFESDSTDHLSATLDQREDGFNAGRTTFRRGATGDEGRPAFLVWSSLGNPAVVAATAGTLQIEAAGGTLQALAALPTIQTGHEEEVQELLQDGTASAAITLSPPAVGLPTWTAEYGPAVTVSVSQTLRDGSIASVLLVRDGTGGDAWVLGKLEWTARARAYRIAPPSGATERVVLLVSAKG